MPQGADDPRAARPGVRSESSESQKSRSVPQGAGVFDVWIAPYPRDAVPHFAVPARKTWIAPCPRVRSSALPDALVKKGGPLSVQARDRGVQSSGPNRTPGDGTIHVTEAPPPGARSNSSGRGSVPWGAEGSLSMFGKGIDLKRSRSTILTSVSAP